MLANVILMNDVYGCNLISDFLQSASKFHKKNKIPPNITHIDPDSLFLEIFI